MKQHTALFLCIAILLFCITPTVSASSSDVQISEYDITAIQNTLAFMLEDPYCTLSISARDISIGNKIDVYICTAENIADNGLSAYPVYLGSDLWAVAFVSGKSVQFDEEVARELLQLDQQNRLSLLYDESALYAVCDTEVVRLHTYDPVEGRGSIENYSSDALLSLASPYDEFVSYPLSGIEISSSDPASPDSTMSTSAYISVGFQNQPAGAVYCWACSDASIGNKITGWSTTGLLFANYFCPSYITSKQIDDAIDCLNQYYSTMTFPYTVYNAIPSIEQILYFLGYNHPIYGEFQYSGNSSKKHATVIRGANSTTGYISMMDPDLSSSYRTATMAWVGTELSFTYTNTTDGTFWYLVKSAYPNYWA